LINDLGIFGCSIAHEVQLFEEAWAMKIAITDNHPSNRANSRFFLMLSVPLT